jgi:hypothetical protein
MGGEDKQDLYTMERRRWKDAHSTFFSGPENEDPGQSAWPVWRLAACYFSSDPHAGRAHDLCDDRRSVRLAQYRRVGRARRSCARRQTGSWEDS